MFFKRVGISWARLTLSRSCLVTFTNVTGVSYFALIALTVTSSKLKILIRESWSFWLTISCEKDDVLISTRSIYFFILNSFHSITCLSSMGLISAYSKHPNSDLN